MNQLIRPPIKAKEQTATSGDACRELYRLSVDQYHRMVASGILKSSSRVELLQGYLVAKMSQKPPHARCLKRLMRRLPPVVPEDYVLGFQTPITLKDSEPEPDASIAQGPEQRYEDRHPGPRDTLLVIEIGDSSLLSDQRYKGALYAQAKIPIYWIINLVDEVIEVYTSPRGGKNPAYQDCTTYGKDAMIPLAFAGQEFGQIAVKDLLP